MSCNNCPSTVWFDHDKKVWRHARKPATACRKPEPYNLHDHPLPPLAGK